MNEVENVEEEVAPPVDEQPEELSISVSPCGGVYLVYEGNSVWVPRTVLSDFLKAAKLDKFDQYIV